ncbi:MAG: hypothetical protein AAGI44_09340, partial [Pseudomonadota bacterium]
MQTQKAALNKLSGDLTQLVFANSSSAGSLSGVQRLGNGNSATKEIVDAVKTITNAMLEKDYVQ